MAKAIVGSNPSPSAKVAPMPKRGHGEGSITKRADGRWMARILQLNGKRKYFYGTTRAEVQTKLGEAVRARQQGKALPTARLTVEEFFSDWLKAVEPQVRYRSFLYYKRNITMHANPEIGRISLQRLTPLHLQQLYAKKLSAGLSSTSVHHLAAVIHRALADAERWGLVGRNVAGLAKSPRIRRTEMKTLDAQQVRQLLDTARDERNYALYVLAVTTGMRQGEILALRWKDVDLEGGSIRVTGSLQPGPDGLRIVEPKTKSSRRQITLTPMCIDALRAHRKDQITHRMKLGDLWHDHDLVFCTSFGNPIWANEFTNRTFRGLLEKAGLPRIRFHDLRHTAATLMLSQGVHPKIAQEMLGHTTIAITLDLYSHATATMQLGAANAIQDLLAPTPQSKRDPGT
ncbi:MAG TPA: tyrosine-type recombinase/integrase [Candidatus Baltobacterales bacterium]|nr:tyrosine-type recombinase/integrase [Candidatus Baltobacterales bacterium]